MPLDMLTLDQAGIRGNADEDGATLKENALKKARFAYNNADNGAWAIADDTGLFIDSLNGLPGIRSGRWVGESATTQEIMDFCLAKLSGDKDRSATFTSVVAVIAPEGGEEARIGGEGTEVASKKIGELVAKRLKKLDKLAYIRFASVFRQFVDIEDFDREIKKLL